LKESGLTTYYFGVETTDPNFTYTFDIYHTDLDTAVIAGQWHLGLTHDAPGGEIVATPSEALLYANQNARVTLTSIPPGYEFIGATPNVPFWILPQNVNPAVLYLGQSSEQMSPADLDALCVWNPGDPRGGADQPGKWIRVSLIQVRGPEGGDFSMWQAGLGSPTVYFSTHDGGVTAQDVYHGIAGGHAHMNWAFTQAGLYEVDLQAATFVASCEEDLDRDGHIDQSDLGLLLGDYGCDDGPGNCPGDINGDGLTDQSDLGSLLSNYGVSCL
jgi:hypothetical protein